MNCTWGFYSSQGSCCYLGYDTM